MKHVYPVEMTGNSSSREKVTEPYKASCDFETHGDYALALSQGVAQDVIQLAKDADEIRLLPIQCMVLKATDDNDEAAPEFIVLVRHGITVCQDINPFLALITTLIVLKKDLPVFQFHHSLLYDHRNAAIAFGPPTENGMTASPDDENADNYFWDAQKIIIEDEWKEADANMAFRIRRPTLDARNAAARHHKIEASTFVRDATWVNSYFLKLDAGLKFAQLRVNGVWRAIEEDAPADRPDQRFPHLLRRELHAYVGFPSLLKPPV